LFSRLPHAGLISSVERYFEFVQQMAEMNRDLTVRWVEAASALSGVVREQVPVEPAGPVGDGLPSLSRPGRREGSSCR